MWIPGIGPAFDHQHVQSLGGEEKTVSGVLFLLAAEVPDVGGAFAVLAVVVQRPTNYMDALSGGVLPARFPQLGQAVHEGGLARFAPTHQDHLGVGLRLFRLGRRLFRQIVENRVDAGLIGGGEVLV